MGRDDALASASTLCRLENKAARHTTRLIHRVLIETIRRLGLRGTAMARAQCGTIRLKLLKIGAVVLRNYPACRQALRSAASPFSIAAFAAGQSRRVQLLWSSSFPNQGIFAQAWKALSSA